MPELPSPATVVIVPPDTFRIRLLSRSAMKRLPAESTATPWGYQSDALVAGPPSPEKPAFPFPATTVNTPFGEIRTTMLFPESAAYTLPRASTATPEVVPKGAFSACTLDLGKNQFVPATVLI